MLRNAYRPNVLLKYRETVSCVGYIRVVDRVNKLFEYQSLYIGDHDHGVMLNSNVLYGLSLLDQINDCLAFQLELKPNKYVVSGPWKEIHPWHCVPVKSSCNLATRGETHKVV